MIFASSIYIDGYKRLCEKNQTTPLAFKKGPINRGHNGSPLPSGLSESITNVVAVSGMIVDSVIGKGHNTSELPV
jgi:hypothetical protein